MLLHFYIVVDNDALFFCMCVDPYVARASAHYYCYAEEFFLCRDSFFYNELERKMNGLKAGILRLCSL